MRVDDARFSRVAAAVRVALGWEQSGRAAFAVPGEEVDPTGLVAGIGGRVGCLPFAAGAVLPAEGAGFLPDCPFRTMTGLPCPMCGATRAFTHVARGDGAFLHYNAFWVLVALAMIVAGVIVLLTRRPFTDGLTRTPRRAALTIAVLGGLGWAYALAERATIAPPA